MKMAACIVLYFPTDKQLKNIEKYAKIFDYVYIFDNTDDKEISKLFRESHNISYCWNGENIGLPRTFNKALKLAEKDKYDFLCTLDQDGDFPEYEIEKIIEFIEKNISRIKENVGIVAPYIQLHHEKRNFDKREYINAPWAITSGSFLNLYLLKKKNIIYDNNYFIDKFEIDFCKQITNSALQIWKYNKSVLKQDLGEDSGYRHPNHSPLRHYYLFRNRFYFNHKFYSFIKRWILNILQTLRHCYLIVRYENNKMAKLSMLPIALKDYRKNALGKRCFINDII